MMRPSLALLRKFHLVLDQFQEQIVHLERRDEQLLDALEFGKSRQGIEEHRDFLAKSWLAVKRLRSV